MEKKKWFVCMLIMFLIIPNIVIADVKEPANLDKSLVDFYIKISKLIDTIKDSSLRTKYHNTLNAVVNSGESTEQKRQRFHTIYHEVSYAIIEQDKIVIEPVKPPINQQPTITEKDKQNFIDYFAKLDRMINSIIDGSIKSVYKERLIKLQATIFTLDKPYDALNAMYHEIDKILNSQVTKPVVTAKENIDNRDSMKDDKVVVDNNAKLNDEVKVLLQRLEIITKRLEELERLTQLQKKELDELKSRPLENRIYLQGQTLEYDVKPMIVNGRTLVPVRTISEGLGAIVDWESTTRTVVIKKDGKIIKLPIGSYNVDVDGKTVVLDVPATVVNGRTMVPLRFISEALGEHVMYNESTGDIDIGLNLLRNSY